MYFQTIFLESVKGGLVWSCVFFIIWSLFVLLETKKTQSSLRGPMSFTALVQCTVGISWGLWIVTVEKTKFGDPLALRERDFILFSLRYFVFDSVVRAAEGQTSMVLHHFCCGVAEICTLHFEVGGGEIVYSFILGELFFPLFCILDIERKTFGTSRFASLRSVYKVGFFVCRIVWLAIGMFFILPGDSSKILKLMWAGLMGLTVWWSLAHVDPRAFVVQKEKLFSCFLGKFIVWSEAAPIWK